MKVAAIIQARMGSTRLPGKILKTVNGKSLLEYQIERIKRAKLIDEIIIATTVKENDDPIVQLCQQLSVSYYRGSETDVLTRYYETAIEFKVGIIVRITSDCPVIDPEVIDQVISRYLIGKKVDYVSNTLELTFPRGMDTEVFSFDILQEAYLKANEKFQREHVTPYIYTSEKFKLCNVNNTEENQSHIRVTVDTLEDFLLVKEIIMRLYVKNPQFNLTDIVDLINSSEDLQQINSHISQKNLKD